MIVSVAGGRGGAGKLTIATNGDLKGCRFWGYFPFGQAFTQAEVEGKTILEYDINKQIKVVLVGPWKKLRREIQKQNPN